MRCTATTALRGNPLVHVGVPALIRLPDPFAPLQEWLDYRDGLDVLEAGLHLSHPDMDWLYEMRKAEADAVIGRMARWLSCCCSADHETNGRQGELATSTARQSGG